MKKHHLFTPGPTPIPHDALLAMAQPIDYHRSELSTDLILDVLEKLKHVLASIKWILPDMKNKMI